MGSVLLVALLRLMGEMTTRLAPLNLGTTTAKGSDQGTLSQRAEASQSSRGLSAASTRLRAPRDPGPASGDEPPPPTRRGCTTLLNAAGKEYSLRRSASWCVAPGRTARGGKGQMGLRGCNVDAIVLVGACHLGRRVILTRLYW